MFKTYNSEYRKIGFKPANEHFAPYLGKSCFNRLKITSKVLEIEQRIP